MPWYFLQQWRPTEKPWQRSALPAVVAALGMLLTLRAPLRALGDPDTYWHIAAGNWMLAHHAVPRHDPFIPGPDAAPPH